MATTKDKLIHQVLEAINWDYVYTSFKMLNLTWYEEKKPTRNQLIVDLSDLLNLAFEQPNVSISTEHWYVCYNTEQTPTFEVSFVPFVICTATNLNTKANKIANLRHRLDLAQKTENYELCARLKKTLDNLEKPKVKN